MSVDWEAVESELGRDFDLDFKLDVSRRFDLGAISFDTRHGVVDGVEIDLRHPSLPPTMWRPVTAVGTQWRWDDKCEWPWFIFPWSDPEERKATSRSSGACWVNRGDRIAIEFVRRVLVGSKNRHPADREARAASLVVERSSGRRSRPNRPLLFYRPLSLEVPGPDGRVSFGKIVGRVCDALGVNRLGEFEDLSNLEGQSSLKAAFYAAKRVRLNARMYLDHLNDPEWDYTRDPAASIDRIVDDAVALGYHAAQAEAAQFVAAPASRKIRMSTRAALRAQRRLARRKSGSKAGGRESGVARAKKADIKRDIARNLIAQIIQRPGPHKREAIVQEVIERWPPGDVACPKRSWVGTLLKETLDGAEGSASGNRSSEPLH